MSTTSGKPKAATGPSPARRGPHRIWWWLGGAVTVVFIIAVIASISGEPEIGNSMPEQVVVDIVGAPLPPLDPTVQFDPAVGRSAPKVSGINFAGEEVAIINDGRAKAVVFLAHWCPHCQRDVRALQAHINENGLPEGADFYSVATSIDPSQPNYPPSAWLNREGWTAPVLVDDANSSVARAFGLTSFPYYVFIDAQGNVAARMVGEQEPNTIAAAMAAMATP